MSHNLTLDAPDGVGECALWQTPTAVTDRLIRRAASPLTTYQIAAGYLDWCRENLRLPPITVEVRMAASMRDPEAWIAGDPAMAPFRGKMAEVGIYLNQEQQVMAAIGAGYTFGWI